MSKPDWYLFEFGDRNAIISKHDHLVNDEGEPWVGFQQRMTPLYEHAADVERLEDELKVLRGTRKYLLDNETIYKERIKDLHRLLGQMVHRTPGTVAYNETRAEAQLVVLNAYMSESTNGVANNE